jgi:NAD(P)-dependent dehydrogenase (short-subunit alcohol dehydrogenase family)
MRITVVGSGPLAIACREAIDTAGHTLIEGRHGTLDAAIFVPWNPALATPCRLTELSDDGFGAAWQDTMDMATAACVNARERMLPHGGTIVLTAPTIGQSGASQYAHWSAAAEGVRVLAKSVARQWGADGITVNAITVSPALALSQPELAGTTSLAAPALPTSAEQTAGFIVAFCALPRTVTGQTIASDGGVWMS